MACAAPRYFYDRLGSHLFEAITELPEYYPTRTEATIFAAHGAEMARAAGSGGTLVDLGAGNCAKAANLMPLFEPERYLPIDVSVEFLQAAVRNVQREHPQLDIVGVGMDFAERLDLPADLVVGRPLWFYPGSSIGNLTPEAARRFLRRLRSHAACAEGCGLLIGIDLVKPRQVLEAAYDDALGVTAAFNLNLLRHLNRVLDADFAPRDWRHVAFFDATLSRIEMHLEARRDLVVRWPGAERRFAAGERIHTENSCKYTIEGFAALLADAGFSAARHWTDERGWFAVFHAVGR